MNPWLIVEMWPAYVFSIGTTLIDVLQNWLSWFHYLFHEGSLLIILIDFHDFSVTFLDVTKMPMSTVSLSIECFPLTYNLNVFKSRINRHISTVGSF